METDLETTGTGTTVKVGLGTMNWSTGKLTPTISKNLGLYDSNYVSGTLKDSESYYYFITNNTYGVLSGTIDYYEVLSLG